MPTATTITAIFRQPKQQLRRGKTPQILYRDGWGVVTCEVTDSNGDERFTPGQFYDFSGSFNPADFIRGTEYLFSGAVEVYRGQPQFKFTGFTRPNRELTDGEYLAYLSSCRALSPVAVRELFKHYGHATIDQLKISPAECVAHLKLINSRIAATVESITTAANYFRDREGLQSAIAEVTGLLAGVGGFPKSLPDAVVGKWGVGAADKIRRNPYLLMKHFTGVGFAKADALYTSLGLPPNKLRRQALAAWNAVSEAEDGDTWMPVSVAVNGIKAKVSGVDKTRAAAAIRLACKFDLLATYTDDDGREWIAEGTSAAEEAELAALILIAMDEPNPWEQITNHPQAAERFATLSDHQRDELLGALTSSIAGLTGGPGTGKTYTAAPLVKLCIDVFGEKAVAITALAGKAAQRSTESLQEYGISIRARTTHSLLRVEHFGGKGQSQVFEFNASRKLPAKVIIVDEVSLDNVSILLAVFRARAPGTAVLLIGDKGQLLPIGGGAPLRDLERAGVPFARLTETHRNAGTVVRICEAIGKGLRVVEGGYPVRAGLEDQPLNIYSPNYIGRFASPAALDINAAKPVNLAHLHASAPEVVVERVIEAIQIIRDKFHADPVWELQIIVARNGEAKEPAINSRIGLNTILQGVLNAEGVPVGESKYRINDKCIQLENESLPVVDIDGKKTGEEANVSNGEFCRIVSADEDARRVVLEFSAPYRLVLADVRGSFDLGYAATCHKMQGSQEKWCVYVIDEMWGVTREHPFTGFSRCVKGGFSVGDLRLLNKIIAKGSGVEKRKTFLTERIVAGRVFADRCWWRTKAMTTTTELVAHGTH
jgi:exodeoxyribonuclease V alpha subunit